MNSQDKGQVIATAAEIYDEFFVPALFQQWTNRVADAANIQTGQHVLDVACGTGVLTRTIAQRIGDSGSVMGLDVNKGMLAVARKKSPEIEWKIGQAESLTFDDANFDAVVSQFALMFFENRAKAIAEMIRVLRPGGKLAIAVWDTLENTPGYAAVVNLLQRLFGDEAASSIRAPFNLGDVNKLRALFQQPTLKDVNIETQIGVARFPSIESWMFTDIKGWVLADRIDNEQYATLLKEAKTVLAPFANEDGQVQFEAPAHIVSATKN